MITVKDQVLLSTVWVYIWKDCMCWQMACFMADCKHPYQKNLQHCTIYSTVVRNRRPNHRCLIYVVYELSMIASFGLKLLNALKLLEITVVRMFADQLWSQSRSCLHKWWFKDVDIQLTRRNKNCRWLELLQDENCQPQQIICFQCLVAFFQGCIMGTTYNTSSPVTHFSQSWGAVTHSWVTSWSLSGPTSPPLGTKHFHNGSVE